MAEVTSENLYNQLTPMGQLYYDQQFSKQYKPGQENILLSSQPEYNKMKAVFEAEQQVPEKSLLDTINIFGSASAAEPDKINTISNNPGFETVVNPDGTISIVPVGTSSELPFKSMAELAAANANLNLFPASLNQTKSFLNVPRGLETLSPGTGIPGVREPDASFRMIPGYVDRNTNIYRGDSASAKEIMDLKPLGFDTSFGVANEPDVRQVDFLGTRPNRAQQGIAKLFEFLQRFSPVANVARGIESIRNRFDTNRAIRADVGRDTQGTIDRTPSPRIMNMQPSDSRS